MVNSPCCRRREPPRSTPRRLGFIIGCLSGPRGRGTTSPFCGLRFPRDPSCVCPGPLLWARSILLTVLVSLWRSYIVVGFIPFSTPLSKERHRWHHLTSDHRGQCYGGRCDVLVCWHMIGLNWIPEIYEQLSRIRESKGTHDILPIMLIRSSGRKSDVGGAARLPSPMSNAGGGQANRSGCDSPAILSCDNEVPGS